MGVGGACEISFSKLLILETILGVTNKSLSVRNKEVFKN